MGSGKNITVKSVSKMHVYSLCLQMFLASLGGHFHADGSDLRSHQPPVPRRNIQHVELCVVGWICRNRHIAETDVQSGTH